jgi:hypothetical protein
VTAPVSGPGPYSQRTDKQPIRDPGGLPYGENQQLRQIQQSAPMAQTNATPPPAAVGFDAPTNRPGQPVTAGADAGAGPGSEALSARAPGLPAGSTLVQALSRAAGSDTTGTLASLLVEAMKRGL